MRPRLNKTALLSVAISFICHAFFFIYSGQVWFKGVVDELRTKQLFDVKLVEQKKPPVRSIIAKATPQDIKFRFRRPFTEPLKDAGSAEIIDKVEKKTGEDIQTSAQLKEAQMQLPDIRPVDYAKGTVLEEKKRQVKKDIIDEPGMILAKDSNLPQPEYEPIALKEFEEQMPGFTPTVFAPERGTSGLTKIPYKRLRVEDSGLDVYLAAELVTYTDKSDGKKYFRITIMAGKDVGKLSIIPKEIIFLVDCSLSIQEERIENFKKGLLYCLNNLNKDDIFNIISFKEKIQRLSSESSQPNKNIIKSSNDFISGLKAGSLTDVYGAFQQVIKIPAQSLPSYIMLLSDGKPTVGTQDSRKIISNISRINQGERAIFCYSGGGRVNRYLLDFIAYQNRGWSEYSTRTYDITRGLRAFYNKIKDPLLLNLRYRFSQLSSQEAYPKNLPDFFKDATFTIFGTYSDEDEFSMQLIGETKEGPMEFIFSDSLKQAAVGNADIARQWALNKVYYLLGKLAENKDTQAIIDEINNLCQKFNIKTPYLDDIR